MSRFAWNDEPLGQGGFGRVFPASRVDEDMNIVEDGFAIKFLLDKWCENEEAVARFQREARLQQEELDHAHILPVVARNLSANPPWFVMPLASHSLKDSLGDGLHRRREDTLAIFEKVLQAMAHAHSRSVLHRDLKPGNVLFVDDEPCVSDFGLGKRMGPDATDLTRTDQPFGTRCYMAPEQMSAKEATRAADVYSLGKLLGELLTGEPPEPFVFHEERMPREYRYFLRRCCDMDPAKRYQSAGEMLEAFEVLTSAREVVDPPLEGAQKLVQEWMMAAEGPDIDYVRALDEHFRRYAEEEELYSHEVPRLPPVLIEQYMAVLPGEFRELIATYDGHINGALAFSYCDLVANFYAAIWPDTDDLELKRIVLARLWRLGPTHNRWHVGGVLADVLVRIDDPGETMIAVEVIRAEPQWAEWNEPYLKRLAKPIRNAIDEALDQESE